MLCCLCMCYVNLYITNLYLYTISGSIITKVVFLENWNFDNEFVYYKTLLIVIQLHWYRSVERSITFSVSYYRILRTDFSQGLFMNAVVCCLVLNQPFFFFSRICLEKSLTNILFYRLFLGFFLYISQIIEMLWIHRLL